MASQALQLEFASLLRKLTNRGSLSSARADFEFENFLRLQLTSIPLDDALLARAYELATQLNQSDVFDAAGYATAEAYGAEFWTSDRRFANAANAAGLANLRFIS